MLGLALAVVLAADAAPEWQLLVDSDVKVFMRAVPGARVEDIRGDMTMSVTAAEVRAVLLDADYAKRAPYMAEYREISQPAPNVWIHYTRLALPIVDDRDYFIEITRESDLAPDGTGVYLSRWKACCFDRPPRRNVVRMTDTSGYWQVKPAADPAHAEVEYFLHLDPGGLLPAWIAVQGNKRILPDVMRGIQDEALRRRKQAH